MSRSARGLRAGLVALHRWLSLSLLALWLVQAVTGMICVFHWELDDASIRAPERPFDADAIARRIGALAPPRSGLTVTQLWTSAGGVGRWDVSIAGRRDATVRINGAGDVLRVRRSSEIFGNGGLLDTIDNLHQTLLAGDTGGWIIGLSGVLLLSNLGLGLYVAWPRAGQWRRALDPTGARAGAARFHSWHRALGLWLVLPVMLLVATGVERAFSDGLEELIGAKAPPPMPVPPDSRDIGFARAVRLAQAREPQARLTAVIFPTARNATWQIRLLEPGEWARAYGKSSIYVDARDGHIILQYDAPSAPLAGRIADAVLPIHTGEVLGPIGRIAVLALGAWLVAMMAIGASLWQARSSARSAKPKEAA